MKALLLAGLLLVVSGMPATAQEKSRDLQAMVKDLLSADKSDRDAAIRAIVALNPAPGDVEGLLKQGRTYERIVDTDWQVFETYCSDGETRPFHACIPANYDSKKEYPVLINLHGGVSTPELFSGEAVVQMREMWFPEAGEFIHIVPLGQQGCEWWTEVGASAILGALDVVKRTYNVDENRVYLTGFSDGGSGTFYMALNHTTPFAAFAPLSGLVLVAEMGGQEVCLPNLGNKFMCVVNGAKDELYPIDMVRVFNEAIEKANSGIRFVIDEDAGHSFSYGDGVKPEIIEMFGLVPRTPFPKELTLESSDTAVARCHYVRITKIEKTADGAAFEDLNPMLTQKRVLIGVQLDQGFEGPGVKISGITAGSLAERLKMQPADIIVKLNDVEIENFEAVRAVMAEVKPGDECRLSVRRGEEVLEMSGNFDRPEPKPAFTRAKTAGRLDVSVKGNAVYVKSRSVSLYTVLVSRDQFDVNSDIEVTTNGKVSFNGRVKPDVGFMLSQYVEDRDRKMVFWGRIDIDVAKTSPEK
jgi:hypothetical protein